MKKEEKQEKKIFYEKSKRLQVSRVSVSFKIWSSSTLWHVILWSTKTIKSTFKICFSNTWNQFEDPAPHLFSYHHHVTNHHDIFLKPVTSEFPHRIIHQFLVAHSFIDGLLLFRFISLYFVILSLIASSCSSFVFIQFRQVIFNFFVRSNSDLLFIYY